MGLKFDPESFYDERSLCEALAVSTNALRKARKAGELNPSRPGNTFIYRGDEIIAWLNGNKSASDATAC